MSYGSSETDPQCLGFRQTHLASTEARSLPVSCLTTTSTSRRTWSCTQHRLTAWSHRISTCNITTTDASRANSAATLYDTTRHCHTKQ